MSVRKLIGYSFLGCGTVFLIFAVFVFFNAMGTFYQFFFISHESYQVSLAACVPYLILALVTYVIGGVSYCLRRVNPAKLPICTKKTEITPNEILGKLKKLDGIDDSNFNVIVRIPDDIPEKQNIVSQSIKVQAKKRINRR